MSETRNMTLEAPAAPQPRRTGGGGNPAALVLNLFYSGLAIARDLAPHGVRVIGLSANRKIYGNFSRFCETRFIPDTQESPDDLAKVLLDYAPELQGSIIFPTRDADVLFLDRYREALEPYYCLNIPPRDVLMRVLNKYELVRAAIRAGVPVPRTALVSSHAELRDVETNVGFPCVLKPVQSVQWRMGDSWNRVGARKAIQISNPDELRREYDLVSAVNEQVLIQEMVPGPAENIVILGGYVGSDSKPLAVFTARKLVQTPDDFGTGCVVEAVDIPELHAMTARLFAELEYQGMAEVEYKQDSATGEYKLIEINTRHWDWHQLGNASGINVSLAAYSHLAGKPYAPGRVDRSARARWIGEDAFLMYALRNLYWRRIGFRDLLRKIRGHRMYGVFAWNDPIPFIRYFFSVMLPEVASAIFNKIRGGSHQS
jgi:D-aspartate ligase